MGQETSSGDVLAFLVGNQAVGRLHIVSDGGKDLLVGVAAGPDGDNPFDALSRGAGEHQRSFELGVCKELIAVHLNVRHVVEVQA